MYIKAPTYLFRSEQPQARLFGGRLRPHPLGKLTPLPKPVAGLKGRDKGKSGAGEERGGKGGCGRKDEGNEVKR